MNINDYSKSREEYLRACKVIPSGIYGHQGPAEGCYTPVEAWPLFFFILATSNAVATYSGLQAEA